ncbi:regulator of chromosome condensation (RCC1)-like protein [Achlya hypogyna]|uniref:Regulator of chromosome condensation (RCC1)-like protein n=1 Tax=Achlya hypogyna TaxID=1202772 RepID=A0A1V9ZS94_ACHHY|nr:regulator of chromosome condensation (RCC1)-like protein [Achlya hypogyna]
MPAVWFVWGSGADGQLGIGDTLDYSMPTEMVVGQPEVGSLAATPPPVVVITGGCHSAAIDASGTLYTWGSNAHGQLGHSASSITTPSPMAILPVKARTTTVACGWAHSVVATTDSTEGTTAVFSCGSNQYDQLGHTHDSATPLRVFPATVAVVSLACGWKHSLLATSTGHVYAWGLGRHGELGLGPDQPRATTPTQLPGVDGVVAVHCGWQHSVLHLASREILVTGNNRHGQLGLGNDAPKSVMQPQPLPASTPFDAIAVGWHHVIGLVDGQVYSWGRGAFGQLGYYSDAFVATPQHLDLPPIAAVACGSEHSLFLTQAGELLTCGWGEHGNLGHGDGANVTTPTPVAFFHRRRLVVDRCCAAGAVSMARAAVAE